MDRSQLPKNVERLERRQWQWNGVLVEQVDEFASGEVLHSLLHADQTRMTVTLDEIGSQTEPRLKPHLPCRIEHKPNYMNLVPQGLELWGAAPDLRHWRYLTIAFNPKDLEARLEEGFDARAFESPRIRFTDPRILTLARLLIDIPSDDRSSALLGDSLTTAIFSLLSAIRTVDYRDRKLAPWQEQRAKNFMRERLSDHVELREVASLVGQSQWHFCRAFKATTGLSPYQWQLTERLNLVQHRLLDSDLSLDHVAEITGFGDAMHLIRVFKKRIGETPGAWRRARKVKAAEDS